MAIPIKCYTGAISIDAIAENTQKPIFDVGIIPHDSQYNHYCSD